MVHVTYPQHTNYTETAGLSVVGRFMLLVLFYMQLQQPTPQRFPPGVIYMVFMSNNEAPQLDRTLYIAPFCPHLLARRKKKRRPVRLYSSFNVFLIATPARPPEGNTVRTVSSVTLTRALTAHSRAAPLSVSAYPPVPSA